MNALATIRNLLQTDVFYKADLRYCFVDDKKHPLKVDGELARPNDVNDFVSFDKLAECQCIEKYAGIGISIQASKVCAIDIDKCFSKEFDISSADNRAKDIIELFKDCAYIEFSFSGKGMRILFRSDVIKDYALKYYIKNDKNSIEYYQPSSSYRYVTITGVAIAANDIAHSDETDKRLMTFLDKYMKRQIVLSTIKTPEKETRSFEELMKVVRHLIVKDIRFQDMWFAEAPGSGKNESQMDYHLLARLYEEVTQDKDFLKDIFEESDYFKSKDLKHMHKWKQNDYRYYKYVYSQIASRKS